MIHRNVIPALRRSVVGLVLCGTLVGATAHACNTASGIDTWSGNLTVSNELSPDVPLTGWLGYDSWGAGGTFGGCSPRQEADVAFAPAMGGLRFVRDIEVDGVRHAAYEWSGTSPLVVFRYRSRPDGSGTRHIPLDALAQTVVKVQAGASSIVDNNKVDVALHFRLLSRGGPMTPVPSATLGGRSTLQWPSSGALNHQLTVSVNIRATPCALSNTDTVLDAITSTALPSPGATAGRKATGLRVDCPFAGTRVQLQVVDNLMGANTSDRLTATPASTARGVVLQLLHNATPVTLRSTLDMGTLRQGVNVLPLEARYVRTNDPLVPGLIQGQAVVIANYQ